MKLKHMSKKAKEKHADWMLDVSAGLCKAALVALLVVPLGAMLTTSSNHPGLGADFPGFMGNVIHDDWGFLIFMTIEAVLLGVINHMKDRSCQIYNELYPDPAG